MIRSHETTNFCTRTDGRRASTVGNRAAFGGCFCVATEPDCVRSSRGERAPAIAQALGCNDETVRDVIRTFNEQGVGVLSRRSSRPHHVRSAFSEETAQRLKAILHESPRQYGKETSLWTLELAAEVSFEKGLTLYRVSDETIRTAL